MKNIILQSSPSEWKEALHELGIDLPMWLILLLVMIVLVLGWVIKRYWCNWQEARNWRKKKMKAIANTDFSDYLPFRKKRLYIPAMYQSKTPSDYPDPIDATIAEARQNLLDKMLEVLDDKHGRDNLFCILAGAGMGKSSFMVYLYGKLVKKLDGKGHDVEILSLTHPDVIERINMIEDQGNVILLLDALDENVEAMNNYEVFWKTLLNSIKDFNRVVITCRTQFFSSFDEEPNYTEIANYSSKKGTKFFIRYYLSPFTKEERTRYIKNKYPFWHFIKRRKAMKVMENNDSLMSRPLLLANIDDLINSKVKYDYGFQIYEALINVWATREAQRQKLHGALFENLVKKIPEVSKAAAYELYENLANNAACNMTKEQLDEFEKKHPLNMAELRINSLFNRDVRGNWKFSHKSFFEYFLSEIAFDDWNAVPNIEKFDMGMQFYKQRCLEEFEAYLHITPPAWFVINEQLYSNVIMMRCPNGFNPMHLIIILKEKKISSLSITDNVAVGDVLTPQFMKALNSTSVELLEVSILGKIDLPIDLLHNSQLQMFVLNCDEHLSYQFKKVATKAGFKCKENEHDTVFYRSNAKVFANPYIMRHYPSLDLSIFNYSSFIRINSSLTKK